VGAVNFAGCFARFTGRVRPQFDGLLGAKHGFFERHVDDDFEVIASGRSGRAAASAES
jgi:hypothetical protein